ncbi:cupin domain-containing protein [candidate division KSB1 bacterium]|nr:cupin domain-containing protein [candidate division KSB1 bacterium]
MIHRHYQKGPVLNVAGLNEMIVLIDRTESELTEVALNTWRAGLVGPPHSHDQKEQIFYVTSGKGVVKASAQAFDVGPGHLIYLPVGVEHQTVADKKEALHYLLFNVFSNAEKEGHGSYAEHIEKVKQIRRQQADSGRSRVKNAERSAVSDKPVKHIADIKKGVVFDFGSNSTRLLLDRSETDRFEMVVVTWPKGNRGAMVAHKEKEQTFFVLSGSGIVIVGEEQATVRPGDIVFVPRNTPHTTEAVREDLSYLCLNTHCVEPVDASFEQMYNRIAPGRIDRWKKGDDSVGD